MAHVDYGCHWIQPFLLRLAQQTHCSASLAEQDCSFADHLCRPHRITITKVAWELGVFVGFGLAFLGSGGKRRGGGGGGQLLVTAALLSACSDHGTTFSVTGQVVLQYLDMMCTLAVIVHCIADGLPFLASHNVMAWRGCKFCNHYLERAVPPKTSLPPVPLAMVQVQQK